jgi:hypothetical protein
MTALPTGWALATVGDIADLTDGPFGSNLKTAHYTDAGPRVIRLQNIGLGSFRDERAHIAPEHFERLVKHAVRPLDIVAASLGEHAPRACLVPPWLGPAIVKADCIRVRARDGIEPAFLMWLLNSPATRSQAATSIKGVGRPRLGLGGMRQLAEANTYELALGDVLLSEASGSASEVGKPAIWRDDIPCCCFQNTLIRVRSREALPEYLRLFFLREALTGQFAQAAPGVGIHHLGASRLAKWAIPWCAIEDQRVLVANVERQLSLAEAMGTAIERARLRSAALRRSILERAFAGQLVPRDPADEPASALLERIGPARASEPRATRRRRTVAA